MVDLNRQISVTRAQQGGFSAHILPGAMGYDAATTVIVYSDGTSEPVITGGPLRTDSGAIPSAASGGPFGEPYFQLPGIAKASFTIAGFPLALGTGNYTVDAWYRCASAPPQSLTTNVVSWDQGILENSSRAKIYVNPSANFEDQAVSAPNVNVDISGTAGGSAISYLIQKGITLGVWRHIAVQRRSNLLEAWDDGSKITAVWLNNNYTEPLDFGANTIFTVGSTTGLLIGIGQIRIIPNKAMYPSGATITVPTAPFFTPPA
jgi:hypothetical protein